MLLHESINEYCSKFKLPGVLEHYQYLADIASEENLSYSEYLHKLLEFENKGREQRGKQMVLKMAGFPKIKTINCFRRKPFIIVSIYINYWSLKIKEESKEGNKWF